MTLDALDVLDDDALNALDVDGIARAAANKRARVDVGCARVETNENVAPSADVRATLIEYNVIRLVHLSSRRGRYRNQLLL